MTTTGLSPERFTLPNGLRVLFKRTATTPAVTLHVAIDAGSICDPPDRPGVANLVARTIDRGTERRTSDQVAEDLDNWGVSLVTTASRHTLALSCTCLAEDLPLVLDLVADIVQHPSFPESQVETRRAEVLTQIHQEEDNPAAVAFDAMMAVLYGDSHPYGRRLRGTPESVKAIDRALLRSFHREHVLPSRSCVALVGDCQSDEARRLVHQAFGGWSATGGPAPQVAPPSASNARRTSVVAMPAKSQADVAYGFTGLARRDPDYYAAWVVNTVLGEYALGGRLGDNIRERQGMAYYVSSSIGAGPVAGPIAIRAGVSGENVVRTVAAIDDEVQRMRHEGPTQVEVDESRQYLIGSMPRQLETDAAIAEYLQAVEFHGLGLDYDLRLADLLGRVTRDDAHRVARRLLDPAAAVIVVAGPFDGRVT